MTPDEILEEVVSGFKERKYAAGLAIAFIDLLRHLKVPADPNITSADTFLKVYPRKEFRSPGRRANTLTVELPDGGSLSLRPFYNAIENYIRAQEKRFDYPSCPGHATGAWRDYDEWLNSLCSFTDQQLVDLREKIRQFILLLPNQAFDPASLKRDPPLFSAILESFDLTKHKGELTGAAYQGLVFGFLRADNPHLQVEIDKVRTGSKRLQRVGDIDAWEGARLAITAEVKQYVLGEKDIDQLAAFANEANRRNAIGIICALGFEETVKDVIEAMGVRALDTLDLQNIVELWDPMKQRTAVTSMLYYVKQIEKSSALGLRLDKFLEEASKSLAPAAEIVESTVVAASET